MATDKTPVSSDWSDIELEAAIGAYAEMQAKLEAGQTIVKKRYYEDLADVHGRTAKAFEYRMQNISSVLSDMGLDWISGLPPAKNVGANVAKKIVEIIRSGGYFEGQVCTPELDPEKLRQKVEELLSRGLRNKPKGNESPLQEKFVRQDFVRDPSVIAWVLGAAGGACECCASPAPFVRTRDNSGYLEVHHVRMLSEGGSDTVENAVAICPNCHRELHHGVDSGKKIEFLYGHVTRLVRED